MCWRYTLLTYVTIPDELEQGSVDGEVGGDWRLVKRWPLQAVQARSAHCVPGPQADWGLPLDLKKKIKFQNLFGG